MNIRPFDARDVPEESLRRLYAVTSAVDREDFPDDEPAPFEQLLLAWMAPKKAHEIVERYLAEEGDDVVGYLATVRWPVDDPTNSFLVIKVRPDKRRQGIGRALFEKAIAELEPHGVTKTIIDCVADRPWEPVLERWGMRLALTERRNRLYFSDIDWGLMDRWIQRAVERAGDYEVIHLSSPVADEMIDRWCQIKHVMNTAPEEDLDLADFDMTPEKWRAEEEEFEARGDRWLAAVAVHKPTGEFAGYSDVFVQRYHREQAFQHDTGVDPNHRNKGLGRWLKAEMIKRIARDYPDVTRIDTWNAGSNAPMLGINDEMGFRIALVSHSWQAEFDAIRRAMAGDTAPTV
jgi:mycothiol synthase